MTPCNGNPNSTTWCCGTNTTCCGTDAEVTLPATLGASLPSSTAPFNTISTMTIPSISVARTSRPASTSSVDRPSSLSPGGIAGIVICAVVAAVAVIALLLLWCRWKRRKAILQEAASGPAQEPNVAANRGTLLSDITAVSRNSFQSPVTSKALQLPIGQATEERKSPVEKDGPDDRVFEMG